MRLSRGHADLTSYETCEKIPHNKGIVTGPKTEDGHDAIGDTVLRNPIKGYPTMGAAYQTWLLCHLLVYIRER